MKLESLVRTQMLTHFMLVITENVQIRGACKTHVHELYILSLTLFLQTFGSQTVLSTNQRMPR